MGGRRRNAKFVLFFVAFICIYTIVTNVFNFSSNTEPNKTQEILKAIGKNTTNLVLPNETTILHEPWISCKKNGEEQYLLVLLISSPENFHRRKVIRDVYKDGNLGWQFLINLRNQSYQEGESIKLLFFLGVSQDADVNERLIQEWATHGDVIIDDFYESYLNLTLKTLRMLKWVNKNCYKVTYLVKLDDDVFLNMPKVLEFLLNDSIGSTLIAGHKYQNMSIDEDSNSKWYTPKFLWKGSLPDFVAGFCYILGSQARVDLYEGALKTPMFHLEDVFLTGIVRVKHVKYDVVNIPGILTYWLTHTEYHHSCEILDKYVAIHSVSEMSILCWQRLTQNKITSCTSASWSLIFQCWGT